MKSWMSWGNIVYILASCGFAWLKSNHFTAKKCVFASLPTSTKFWGALRRRKQRRRRHLPLNVRRKSPPALGWVEFVWGACPFFGVGGGISAVFGGGGGGLRCQQRQRWIFILFFEVYPAWLVSKGNQKESHQFALPELAPFWIFCFIGVLFVFH